MKINNMKLNKEKIAELYQDFLEDYDTEGKLPILPNDVLEVICFIIERNPETIDIHPNYTSNSSL
jgi:hypothetical protein